MAEYRVKKYNEGWIVEEKKKSLFKTKWVKITHFFGLPNIPFYYETPEKALKGALEEIEKDIIRNFKKYK